MFLRSRYSSNFQTITDGNTISTKKILKKGAASALKKESHFNYNADTCSIESVSSIGSGKNQIVAFVDLETSIKSKCSVKVLFFILCKYSLGEFELVGMQDASLLKMFMFE